MFNPTIYDTVIDHMDIANSMHVPEYELERQLIQLIGEVALNAQKPVSMSESYALAHEIIHDLLMVGPLHTA